MSEPTVTMTLSRYKELEGKEQAFQKMITDNKLIFIHVPWGSNDYFYSADLDEAFTEIKKEIKYTADLAESWRIKAGGKK